LVKPIQLLLEEVGLAHSALTAQYQMEVTVVILNSHQSLQLAAAVALHIEMVQEALPLMAAPVDQVAAGGALLLHWQP